MGIFVPPVCTVTAATSDRSVASISEGSTQQPMVVHDHGLGYTQHVSQFIIPCNIAHISKPATLHTQRRHRAGQYENHQRNTLPGTKIFPRATENVTKAKWFRQHPFSQSLHDKIKLVDVGEQRKKVCPQGGSNTMRCKRTAAIS